METVREKVAAWEANRNQRQNQSAYASRKANTTRTA
jgi:hypothetical protein